MRTCLRFPLLLTLGVLLLTGPVFAQAGPLQGLDAYIEGALRDWEVPGVGVAVIKDGEVVLARGYGLQDVNRGDPVDENTIFAIGSSTKAFVSAAIGMLVDEGLVDWEDPVIDHLPTFRLHDPYATREMRVRDLLIHSSGLSRGDRVWYATPYSREEVVERVRHLQPSWSFRSRFGYQNIMYVVAGQLLTEVTGQSWDDFTAARIFDPLGMRRSSTSIRALEGLPNVATPHIHDDGRTRAIAWRNIDNAGPAGSINSSAREMAEWIRLHLGDGTHNGRELLSPQAVRDMHSPYIVIPRTEENEEIQPETNLNTYGLAWFIWDYHGHKVVEHGGAIDGMRAQVGMVPGEDLGYVVLSNIGGSTFPNAIVHRILDAYLAPESDKDWSAILLAREQEQRERAGERRTEIESKRVEGTSPSRPLAEYVGTYRDVFHGDVVVRSGARGLELEYAGSLRANLEHWHFDTFQASWTDPGLAVGGSRAFVIFRLDRDGGVESVDVDGIGEFERVEEDESSLGPSLDAAVAITR